MNLTWYDTWSTIMRQHDTQSPSTHNTMSGFHANLFISQWRTSLMKQSKMSFYRQVKHNFGEEPYLGLTNRSYRSHIAKIRSSSHDLMIEKGRYGSGQLDLSRKVCRFCCSNLDGTMTNFECLPLCETPIVESEEHALTECPSYHSLRLSLSDNLKSLLMLKEYRLIMTTFHMKEFGRYLVNCYRLRNPKDSTAT